MGDAVARPRNAEPAGGRRAFSAKAIASPRGRQGGDTIMSKLDQDDRDSLSDTRFAFPTERKEPIEDAAHVRNAIARFNQVEGVSEGERDEAWQRILAAARKFGVDVEEKSWREIGKDRR
jgi:hypothetical protein